MTKLEQYIRQELPRAFAGDDGFRGNPGNYEAVRQADDFLRGRNQMGLLVGGVLTKELPRKDLDVIITGDDIEPDELGIDWWWVDCATGDSRNRNNVRHDVPPAARWALTCQIPGLHILRDVYGVTNEGLPVAYTTLQELSSDHASPILDEKLYTPVQIQYQGEIRIGILRGYDDIFLDFEDLVVLPGLLEREEEWDYQSCSRSAREEDRQFGFAGDFRGWGEGAVRSALSRLFVYQLADSVMDSSEKIRWRVKNDLDFRLGWGKYTRGTLYNIFHGLYLEEVEETPEFLKDHKIEKFVEQLEQLRTFFEQNSEKFKDEKFCYALIRDLFNFRDYFSEFDAIHNGGSVGPGRLLGNVVVNKLAVGEIR